MCAIWMGTVCSSIGGGSGSRQRAKGEGAGTITANDQSLRKYKFTDQDTRLYFSNDHVVDSWRCHLGLISVRLERKLQWNPEDESFVGDDEANRWRSREMRVPHDYSKAGGIEQRVIVTC